MSQIPDSTPMSQRAYARRRGINHVAVQKAIKAGRLRASINAAGQIVDPDLADREWAANTDYSEAPMSVIERLAPRTALENSRVGESSPHIAHTDETDGDANSLHEANRREKWAKARLAELKLQEAQGELVPARDVENKLVNTFTHCKTKLMGLPSRARQQLPHLTVADVGILERLVREALEELAAASEVAP